jgi:predicted DNA-binding protein (MmcQ/YjbR family)
MAVIPAFHMNKSHWNTIQFNEDVSDSLILEMVNDSYNLVIAKLPKKLKSELDSF